jgi:hypothetical protein
MCMQTTEVQIRAGSRHSGLSLGTVGEYTCTTASSIELSRASCLIVTSKHEAVMTCCATNPFLTSSSFITSYQSFLNLSLQIGFANLDVHFSYQLYMHQSFRSRSPSHSQNTATTNSQSLYQTKFAFSWQTTKYTAIITSQCSCVHPKLCSHIFSQPQQYNNTRLATAQSPCPLPY